MNKRVEHVQLLHLESPELSMHGVLVLALGNSVGVHETPKCLLLQLLLHLKLSQVEEELVGLLHLRSSLQQLLHLFNLLGFGRVRRTSEHVSQDIGQVLFIFG